MHLRPRVQRFQLADVRGQVRGVVVGDVDCASALRGELVRGRAADAQRAVAAGDYDYFAQSAWGGRGRGDGGDYGDWGCVWEGRGGRVGSWVCAGNGEFFGEGLQFGCSDACHCCCSGAG